MLKKLLKSLNVKEYLPAALKTFGLHPSTRTKPSSVSLQFKKAGKVAHKLARNC
jgi:hypothetical protein